LVDEFGLTDPLDGSRLAPQVIVTPYDRCSAIYLEQELLYDPLAEGALAKAAACLRAGYARLAAECGGVHLIPNASLIRRLNGGYAKVLRVLKRGLDPGSTLLPGPYSLY
jgi:hypothetical protein